MAVLNTTDARGGANPANSSNNTPTIARDWNGHPVRSDHLGRVSLTDMWKATGGEKRNEPHQWLRTDKVQGFVKEIVQTAILRFESGARVEPVLTIRGGTEAGTWAHVNLAVAYAEHLSPAFWLWVTETFLAVRSGKLAPSGSSIDPRILEEIRAVKNGLLELRADAANSGRPARPKALAKRQHLDCVWEERMALCPCCCKAKVIHEPRGTFAAGVRVERYSKHRNRALFRDLWPVCPACYRELQDDDFRDAKWEAFRHYQADAAAWLKSRGQTELKIA